MTLNIEELGLKEVINASGKMTILGVSKVSESVLAAQRYGGEHFFEMADLAEKTGAYLAELLKTEDAQIVSSATREPAPSAFKITLVLSLKLLIVDSRDFFVSQRKNAAPMTRILFIATNKNATVIVWLKKIAVSLLR